MRVNVSMLNAETRDHLIDSLTICVTEWAICRVFESLNMYS